MTKKSDEEKTYSVNLTENQIAIIKAGLQYYLVDEDYGYALWGTTPGACFFSSDSDYRIKVHDIYEELNKMTKVKPNYGWWGDIKRIAKLCREDYKIAKKEGKEAEKRWYENAVLDESIQNEIEKHGLNARDILNKAYKACRETLKAESKGVIKK